MALGDVIVYMASDLQLQHCVSLRAYNPTQGPNVPKKNNKTEEGVKKETFVCTCVAITLFYAQHINTHRLETA